ncbi:MAG: 2Fe-2S iron-sulfur cluster-binding protein [Acidobacteriota bacterium]
MPTVRFGQFAAELAEGESALDALLRQGAPLAHSCKAGSCGSCMVRAVEGDIPAAAQAGLKDSWKARGYVLACVCRPVSDLALAGVDNDAQTGAEIISIDSLGANVMRVRLRCDAPFEFRAGQYLTILRDDGLARSYSIASLPSEGHLELHIRLLPNGRMSQWIRKEARAGTKVRVMGPSGDCFYVPSRSDQPLLLAGTGTGLAPLYGIVRDALAQGHTGPIHLFHGALNESGLYFRDELTQLAAAHPNLTYTPSLFETDGPLDKAILGLHPKPAGQRAFLCGDPALVNMLRKKLFLAGMDLRDIHADAFLPAA